MQYDFLAYHNVRIPLRDGATLAADIYLPPGAGATQRHPALLHFSPYNVTSVRQGAALDWIRRGCVAIYADCRGRGLSDGLFVPWENDVADAWDLLDWISHQEWSSGRVGMVGGSYPAATQLAALKSGHPALTAIAPSVMPTDVYALYYSGGAHELSFMMSWHIGICGQPNATHSKTGEYPDFNALRHHLPLSEIAEQRALDCPSWQTIASNDWRNDYWQRLAAPHHLDQSRAGIFLQGSWFDVLGEHLFETFAQLVGDPAPVAPSNRRFTCLRVGPWGHGVNMHEGHNSYGAAANVSEEAEVNFLTSLLHGKEPATAGNPGPIQLFVMGKNIWRFEQEWPLARTRFTPLYLAGQGHANSAAGDGRLTWEAPDSTQPPDTFTYDPHNPVPTCGGRLVGRGGQRDQSEIETRPDLLVYTTPPLEAELEVTGPVTMRLYAATTACDTDFTVKLVDLQPDGRPFNVCDGILRLRFRDGIDQPPRLATPGEIMALDIEVDVTSYCFLQGHAIRLELSSSNFPRFSRNPNTGTPVASETELQSATQTIFHSALHPSHLLLPIIPPHP